MQSRTRSNTVVEFLFQVRRIPFSMTSDKPTENKDQSSTQKTAVVDSPVASSEEEVWSSSEDEASICGDVAIDGPSSSIEVVPSTYREEQIVEVKELCNESKVTRNSSKSSQKYTKDPKTGAKASSQPKSKK